MAQEICAQCVHLEWNNKEKYSSVERYWCKELHRYKETEDKCRYFVLDKSQKNTGGYKPGGCYITTIVCDILGYEDNCELLEVLRNFRDNYLKLHVEYLPILFEYDKIGPLISEHILKEKNNYPFALGLMKYFLIPCANKIKEENYDSAINIYKNLVIYLNDEFNLPNIVIDTNEEVDLKVIGKGRVRKLKESEN